jgi:hypothetical protein
LTTCQVFAWNFNVLSPGTILEQLRKTVYFFEPERAQDQVPLNLVATPSLATVSPYVPRIREHVKSNYVLLYFPDWTDPQLCGVAEDDETVRVWLTAADQIRDRFYKFGGIIRHILEPDTSNIEKAQKERLQVADIHVLRSNVANVDRDTTGNNVSGYLLCYTNIPVTGDRRFMDKELAYTSRAVEHAVRLKFHTCTTTQHFEGVLNHMNDRIDDRAGIQLELVGTHLLSLGNAVRWTCVQVGVVGRWTSFRSHVREVFQTEDVARALHETHNKIIKSTNPNFPVADVVFSADNAVDPINTIQFTWQLSHPFTLNSLCNFRMNHLNIGHDRIVNVYYMVPGNEEVYARKEKSSFLKGNPDVDLKLRQTTVLAADMRTMWQNTHLFVVKPVMQWRILLEANMDQVPPPA